jgi:hypothetical protein
MLFIGPAGILFSNRKADSFFICQLNGCDELGSNVLDFEILYSS